MSTYVITDRKQTDLSSPIFHAGHDGNDEAAGVFTSKEAAEQYIDHAGWRQTDVVAELEPASLLRWVAQLHAEGIKYLAVNPQQASHEGVPQQPVLDLGELIGELSDILSARLRSPAPPSPTEFVPMDVYHCQTCGQVIKQQRGQSTPTCCDREMTLAAHDSAPMS